MNKIFKSGFWREKSKQNKSTKILQRTNGRKVLKVRIEVVLMFGQIHSYACTE